MQQELLIAKSNMIMNEKNLSDFACKSADGILLNEEVKEDEIRPIFYRDIDRIIHSSAYTRYIDKTQVYPFTENDHITHRVLHVQLVSKIARTIGRSLRLNEDLIEAISLGHDVGHTPFGHKGERWLNDICKKEGIGFFYHNGQSVRVLKDLEGINISMQTLDGILAHNGEILKEEYTYNANKGIADFLQDLDNVFHIENYSKKIIPSTLEAAVVRLADIIAYIGRDIEDSIVVGSIKREDLPDNITRILGNNNSNIVDTLTRDVIAGSMDMPYLKFSKEVFEALMKLKEWNFEHIYESEEANKNQDIVKEACYKLYYIYLDKFNSIEMLNHFIETKADMTNDDSVKRAIIDYIAGQTDKFFLKECEEYIEGFSSQKLYK